MDLVTIPLDPHCMLQNKGVCVCVCVVVCKRTLSWCIITTNLIKISSLCTYHSSVHVFPFYPDFSLLIINFRPRSDNLEWWGVVESEGHIAKYSQQDIFWVFFNLQKLKQWRILSEDDPFLWMERTNGQTCESKYKHSHDFSKQKGKGKYFNAWKLTSPCKCLGNTNYFLSSL